MSLSITRENFDEWMMPVYAPAAFIPVRGRLTPVGSTGQRVYRLCRWDCGKRAGPRAPGTASGVKRPGGEVLAYR